MATEKIRQIDGKEQRTGVTDMHIYHETSKQLRMVEHAVQAGLLRHGAMTALAYSQDLAVIMDGIYENLYTDITQAHSLEDVHISMPVTTFAGWQLLDTLIYLGSDSKKSKEIQADEYVPTRVTGLYLFTTAIDGQMAYRLVGKKAAITT